ncbi:MAG: KGG domain-containing protein [Polyangiaceae bacterium]
MPTRSNGRGFAGMDPQRQREIASQGGKAAHKSGHAHEWNSAEARKAGRLGGIAAHQRSNTAQPKAPAPKPEAEERSDAAEQTQKEPVTTTEDEGRERARAYDSEQDPHGERPAKDRSSMNEQDYR